MPSYRVRDDDESTIVGSISDADWALATPQSPETIKVQKLLILTLALATIAFALALPTYGASTLWVGSGAVIAAYIYGITLFVVMHRQKRRPMKIGKDGKKKRKVPVVTRTPALVCACLLVPVWVAACAMGIWRVTIEIRESREEMKAAWIALRFVEIFCYLGGGISLIFVGFTCSRARAAQRGALEQESTDN